MAPLVPKLRFPEFRGTKGWENVPLGEVYTFKGNNSLSRDKLNYAAGTVKNIHYGDIHTKFSTHFDVTKEHVPFINNSEEAIVRAGNFCTEGDMIFADASEDLADIGKSIEIVRLDGELVVSGLHTILARRIGERVALGFGGHLFKSRWVRSQIQNEAQGSKVLAISPTRLRNLQLPLPHEKAEQQKIAACLNSMDDLIAAQAQKIDALKAHKKGLMQQLFPREGETQPRLRYPEFKDAKKWTKEELGSKTTKVGSGITPIGGDKTYKKSGRPFVRSQNVGWGRLLLDDVAFIDEETHSSFIGTEIQVNDVLLNITGASIGRSVVADVRIVGGNVNQHVCIIRPIADELNHNYLNQFLLSPGGQEQIDSYQAGGNRQGLNFAQIRSLMIPMPSNIEEQQRVGDFLRNLDDLISAITQQLEILKAQKKGLMQQLFPSTEMNEI